MEILEAIKFVSDNSEQVKINQESIEKFAQNFTNDHIAHWLSASPFDFSHLSPEEQSEFLLLFNSTSFSYWGDPKWTVEYEGKQFDGAWGMITALQRAIEEGKPILNTNWRATLPELELQSS